MDKISNKIRAARENRGWSQEGLASACKCSLKTISRAENNSDKISQETLKRIATELGIESEVFKGDKKIQLDEVTTSYTLINKINGSIYQRVPKIDEGTFCWNYMRGRIPKKIEFKLDDFNSEQLPALIEFVTLMEKLVEKEEYFEQTSELLKTQYQINMAIKNLNNRDIKIFFTLRNDRIIYCSADPDNDLTEYIKVYETKKKDQEFLHWEEELQKFLNNKYGTPISLSIVGGNYLLGCVSIPTIYILNSQNPDIKIKNNINYILVDSEDFSYLREQRKANWIRDFEYEDNDDYFTQEEIQELKNKYTDEEIKKLKAENSYESLFSDFFDDKSYDKNNYKIENEFDDEFPF